MNDESPSAVHLASDIGGTFTDFVWVDNRGQVRTKKRTSSADAPSRPVLDLLSQLEPDVHSHGTTVATNAVLERTGTKVAFVTTDGFRDILHIARQDRPDLYNPESTRPSPLIDRECLFDVSERVGPGGEILDPLDESDLPELKQKLSDCDAESAAICLLHSYANPEHEKRIAGALDELPVSCSSDVLPEFREYERANTTVTNAYLEPIVSEYVKNLERAGGHSLFLMKSTEGVGPVDQVMKRPINLLLSGPAGGAIAGARLGENKNETKLINVDMGGTSADISLVIDGEPVWTSSTTIDGLPVGLPMIDVETIGAGGGSIARFDEGGALQVGPESAGSHPGPICYDRGGTRLTVTDAHFVLGHIGPNTELAEQLSLAPERTLDAFKRKCNETSMSVPGLANGILDVINSRMARAIRNALMKHGHDPSHFSLVVFGGAGPLHACDLAERLNVSSIYVPAHPGVFSATGVLQADQTSHKTKTVLRDFTGLTDDLKTVLNRLEQSARGELNRMENIFTGEPEVQSGLDLRYEGQSYEIHLPRTRASVAEFHDRHEELYGHQVPDERVEVVNARVKASLAGTVQDESVSYRSNSKRDSVDSRTPLFHDPFNTFRVFHRSELTPGQSIDQPAIVEEMSATTRIKKGWQGRVQSDGTLRLTVSG